MDHKNIIHLYTQYIIVIVLFVFPFSCYSYALHPLIMNSTIAHGNYTAISDFRVLNRRSLIECPHANQGIRINVDWGKFRHGLSDQQFVTVTVTGVRNPFDSQWVGMITPIGSNLSPCLLEAKAYYAQTGDAFSDLPLLCHYPVKGQYLKNDPDYLSCKKEECRKYSGNGTCLDRTCNGLVKFHVINIRTDIEFVLFDGGFAFPCILARTTPLHFANPNKPLYGHLSSIDSTGSSMRLTWVSGDNKTQEIKYGNGKSVTSDVSTFTADDMCTSALPSPAVDFGWHDPGFIHTAVMKELQPSSAYTYKYGSDSVGWSDQMQFKTPPAGGSDELKFLAFGDMGKTPYDASAEHYIQPGSLAVTKAMIEEVDNGNVDSIFHIGDISYATGFLVEWDYFLNQIGPLASKVSYMTAIGNHERDYINSGSVYFTPDSGGECGVPYETYFPLPTSAKDKPWYSIEQASIHFTLISTEHEIKENSEQYNWLKDDLASVNRSRTPWLVFTGHRPMYSSSSGKSQSFIDTIEPLLIKNKVDLVLFGHVHNYERTCSISQSNCLSMPTKDKNGTDTYDHNNYTAPMQVIIGMAGFSLDKFPSSADDWSLSRISKFGYLRGHATREEMFFELVGAEEKKVEDRFRIVRKQSSIKLDRKLK